MEIGIVILNYLNWKDTVECIDSLYKQKNQSFQIVIVDNNSHNDSIDQLKKRYKDIEKIHLLANEDNLGFAKGNNVGMLYCKTKLSIDNILVINNDVIFTDLEYTDYLINYDFGESVGVVGTEIIGADGKNQNPRYFKLSFISILKQYIYPLLYSLSPKILIKIRNNLRSKNQSENTLGVKSSKSLILHGSVLFFTEKYIQQVNGFFPETFLYYEEQILGLVCLKLGLQMQYDPLISIYHKEDQSSELSFQNLASVKKRFVRKSMRTGLKVSIMSQKRILRRINSVTYKTNLISKNEQITLG